jgi:opacity protein-like surface antigen
MIIILSYPITLLGNEKNNEDMFKKYVNKKLYLSLLMVRSSGVAFDIWGGEDKEASSDIGFSGGYSLGNIIFIDVEFDFLQSKFPDGIEIDRDMTPEGLIEHKYTQDGRSAQFYSLLCDIGYFPFKHFPLSFYGTLGLGYVKKKYHSGFYENWEKELPEIRSWYREDGYKGNGNWSKSHIPFIIGVGANIFFLKYLSLELEYKHYFVSEEERRYVGGEFYYVEESYSTNWSRIAVGLSFSL